MYLSKYMIIFRKVKFILSLSRDVNSEVYFRVKDVYVVTSFRVAKREPQFLKLSPSIFEL